MGQFWLGKRRNRDEQLGTSLRHSVPLDCKHMTLMLVVKSEVAAAFPQFLMSKAGGAGAVSVLQVGGW